MDREPTTADAPTELVDCAVCGRRHPNTTAGCDAVPFPPRLAADQAFRLVEMIRRA